MFKNNFNKKRNMTFNQMPYYQPKNYNEFSEPNNFDYQRLLTEINELKRVQNELLNRISRLESYLGVRGEFNS